MDVFSEIAVMKDKSITKKDFDNLTKGDFGRKEKIKEIKQMWVNAT